MQNEEKTQVLLLPYPAQGHITPMLQFAKRLVPRGIKATLLITNFIFKSIQAESAGSFGIDTVSDGYDAGGFADAESVGAYLRSFEIAGSKTLSEIIKKQESVGCPVSCVVYDAFLPWALDVAKEFGISGAALFTQCCSVNNIYYQFYEGKLKVPTSNSPEGANCSITLPGLPPLELQDMPSYIYVAGSYPAYFEMVLNQYINVEKADWVFVNTFQELEPEVVEWMAKRLPLRTIGPTIPSMYLDKRLPDDIGYGLNLYKPDSSTCMNWLNEKQNGSVVYVSFGSMAELGPEQMAELAWGVKGSDKYFLWVVRACEEIKLPPNFREETARKGLIVKWSPQLDVLAHRSVGCFVTHCGWNSTLEALSFGVPMVGIPQWTDQTTNAKFIQDVWQVGVRAGVDEKGMVTKEEIKRCIRVIMEADRGVEMKAKATLWKKLAKDAIDDGGSSDKNIDEFVSKISMHLL